MHLDNYKCAYVYCTSIKIYINIHILFNIYLFKKYNILSLDLYKKLILTSSITIRNTLFRSSYLIVN